MIPELSRLSRIVPLAALLMAGCAAHTPSPRELTKPLGAGNAIRLVLSGSPGDTIAARFERWTRDSIYVEVRPSHQAATPRTLALGAVASLKREGESNHAARWGFLGGAVVFGWWCLAEEADSRKSSPPPKNPSSDTICFQPALVLGGVSGLIGWFIDESQRGWIDVSRASWGR
jgi:hypothetical protein